MIVTKIPANPLELDLWVECEKHGVEKYAIPFAIKFTGGVTQTECVQAISLLVANNEVLRSHFVFEDGALFRCVASEIPHSALPFSSAKQNGTDTLASNRAQELAHNGLQTDGGCLFKLEFLNGQGDESYLVASFHHLIMDGTSLALISQLLPRLISQLRAGDEAPCMDVAPYSEFTDKLTALNNARGDAAIDYWTDGFSDLSIFSNNSSINPKRFVDVTCGGFERFEISAKQADSIRLLCETTGATPFTVMLSAFGTVVASLFTSRETVVGSPVDLRILTKLDRQIGNCTSLAPTLIRSDPEQKFNDLVQTLRSRISSNIQHSHVGMGKIKSCAEILSDDFVPFAFAFHPKQPSAVCDGVSACVLPMVRTHTRFLLALSISPEQESYKCWIEYAPDKLDKSLVEILFKRFLRFLQVAAMDEGNTVGQIHRDSDNELNSVVEEERTTHDEKSIVEAFQKQVSMFPTDVALRDAKESFTYGQLDEWTNQLAAVLGEMGAKPGSVVGICMSRSCVSVAWSLAVLKTGGCYLPLDPRDPESRLKSILSQAQAEFVLYDDSSEKSLVGITSIPKFHDQELQELTAGVDTRRLKQTLILETSPCYVMATSGSTGTPNLVSVPHSGVLRLTRGDHVSRHCSSKVVLHASSPAFDASTFEIWGALLNGGCVFVFANTILDAEALKQLSNKEVNTLWLTSALFNAIVDRDPACFQGRDAVFVGGEVLSPKHVQQGLLSNRSTKFYNGYGPTEATTFSCIHPITIADTEHKRILIGEPIEYSDAFVLDSALEPCPIGVPGELYVSGPGLATGYLGNAVLTASRFIPNPFSRDGARLYRTGDIACWTALGSLDYLSRVDTQIKLRGQRIELGEIENALRLIHASHNWKVIKCSSKSNQDILVAFCATDDELNSNEIQTRLSGYLPSYMIPSRIISLPRFPLNKNGKLDLSALNHLAKVHSKSGGSDIDKPKEGNDLERAVGKIWEDLLGVEVPSRGSDFFELGGSSLLAAQLCADLEVICNQQVPISKIFEFTRFEEQVQFIRGAIGASQPEKACQIVSSERIPMSSVQSRFWINDQIMRGASQTISFTYRANGQLDIQRLRHVFAKLLDRHEVLRASFHNDDVGLYWQAHKFVHPRFDLINVEASTAKREIDAFLDAPFALAQPSAIKLGVFKVDDGSIYLALSMHHILVDAQSIRIILEELSALYAGSVPNSESEPYSHYCLREERNRLSRGNSNAITYWTKVAPKIRSNKSRWNDKWYFDRENSMREDVNLPANTASLVLRISQKARVSEFSAWLAICALGLVRATRKTVFCIGVPFSLRNSSKYTGTVGAFLNTLPMSLEIDLSKSIISLAKAVHEKTRLVFSNGDVSFDEIVDLVNASSERQPLFDILFGYDGGSNKNLDLTDCELTPVPRGERKAEQDLEIYVRRSDGATTLSVLSSGLHKTQQSALATEVSKNIQMLLSQYGDSNSLEHPIARNLQFATNSSEGMGQV